jgi:hypothetical protein
MQAVAPSKATGNTDPKLGERERPEKVQLESKGEKPIKKERKPRENMQKTTVEVHIVYLIDKRNFNHHRLALWTGNDLCCRVKRIARHSQPVRSFRVGLPTDIETQDARTYSTRTTISNGTSYYLHAKVAWQGSRGSASTNTTFGGHHKSDSPSTLHNICDGVAQHQDWPRRGVR